MTPQESLSTSPIDFKFDNVASTISFTINGKNFTIGSSISPTTTLVDFIRKEAKLCGTKVLCREAGCGVCTVAVTFLDLETGNSKSFSVRSVSKICIKYI